VARAIAAQPRTAVNFAVPAGACDCHAHIICNSSAFPMSPSRTYTPEEASVGELNVMHRALHIDRVVLTNSLVYGTDNSCLLEALRLLGPRARGIALIGDGTSNSELDRLEKGGVKGVRLNFESFGIADPTLARQQFRAAVARIKDRGWHVQINARLTVVQALAEDIISARVPVVFDHFAAASPRLGTGQEGFGALTRLLKDGCAYVKLSAAYRISADTPYYSDVAPLATALISANPERVLWGSDWPHPDSSQRADRRPTDISPFYAIDDSVLLNQLANWAPKATIRRQILVDNPARLYGF
jgi:predicted TIM-barrel fold metal-dependent hydrolase